MTQQGHLAQLARRKLSQFCIEAPVDAMRDLVVWVHVLADRVGVLERERDEALAEAELNLTCARVEADLGDEARSEIGELYEEIRQLKDETDKHIVAAIELEAELQCAKTSAASLEVAYTGERAMRLAAQAIHRQGVAELEVKTTNEGPCCQCGTATNHLAGNPALWPHLLCTDPQQPGVSQVWCEGCLTGMVAENARLKRLAPLSVSNYWLEIVCLKDRVKELERLLTENASWNQATLASLEACKRIAELEAENTRLKAIAAESQQEASVLLDCLDKISIVLTGDKEKPLHELITAAERGNAFKALVHSRLDAMGVPACETEPCIACGGDGYFKGPRLGDEPCPDCNGTGQRPVACRHCNGTKLDPFWSCHVCPVCHGADTVDRLTARLDWVAERLAGEATATVLLQQEVKARAKP